MTVKIAFVGFGGVGQGLLRILQERKEKLQKEEGLDTQVVAVSDLMKGSVYDPEGLDPEELLRLASEKRPLDEYNGRSTTVKGLDSLETIRDTNADMIVEVTFTDVKTGQPAIDHCRAAFEKGKSVITTNKGPVAIAYQELQELADKNGAFWGFEGTVMSGTPALRLPQETLRGNTIREISGILNGTTNYMLTEMEKGLSYDGALTKAKEQGFAEADPTSDVEGYDARYKAVILANVIMGVPLKAEDVACTGITEITQEKLQEAISEGKRLRLTAKITRTESGVKAAVSPEKLAQDNPLAGVQGATNAILYDCDLAGPIFLTGAGAGLTETGFSLLIDLIHSERRKAAVRQT
ncbi:homoserine dehydrogenase [Alkalicoccus urumqiensis]|uniref:Homoserine dehydrogenase n=1 Tax=Alkalicoccus urumqiensis TaxID=1548213 RepID=A0A2P6MDA6_ALKUR|nr:homoserine dehydrogenase [Alkalicoccus urumqiensis]PRO64271.1 homoserine dehydrogenase [Alkalicoccus urumqiensis]